MKNFLCLFLILFCCYNKAYSNESTLEWESLETQVNHIPTHLAQKDKKVLVLIIASDNLLAYLELQKIWNAYMHKDRKHFEVYFIKGNPALSTAYEINGDSIIVKTEESLVPGIVKKTVLSLEAMLPRLKEFDYVLRTNLSSFYYFPNLLMYLSVLPKDKCYSAVSQYCDTSQFGRIYFGSGAGFILSSDLAAMLVKGKEEIFKLSKDLPDDVLIGYFFQKRNIFAKPANRIDFVSREEWENKKDRLSKGAYHFRAKKSYWIRKDTDDYEDEIYILKQLLLKYYHVFLP